MGWGGGEGRGFRRLHHEPRVVTFVYFVIFSLCSLYNWRYTKLGDLPHVNTWPEYCVENPGFFFDYQLINVPDFNGVGESEPNPYFYQVMR